MLVAQARTESLNLLGADAGLDKAGEVDDVFGGDFL